MQKKVVILIVCAVVLLLPTVIAIISYTHAQNHPVTRDSVSKMTLTTPDGEEHEFSRSDKDLLDCFITMNEEADAVPSLLSSVNDYTLYTVEYYSYNKRSLYSYYLTQDPTNAFYRDPDGDLYHISSNAVAVFLQTKFATPLFPTAFQPVLTIGASENVLPQTMDWQYLGFNGQFLDSKVNVSDEKAVCEVSGGLQLSFDRQPDHLFVTIRNPDGVTVFQDVYEKIDPALFTDNTIYDVSITAKWYEADGRDNYGEATYRFTANVLSPAVFYVSTNEQLRYGDFVIVSAKNIVDPSKIGFRSEPALHYEPVFFEYGGYYHALVPFSLDLEDINNKELNYRFTLTYGDVTQEMMIQLSDRKIQKAWIEIPAEKVAEHYSDAILEEFERTMKTPLMAKETTLYWMKDNMLMAPTTRSFHAGFGLQIIHSAAGVSYENLSAKYRVRAGDGAAVCLPGKVVYVGETAYSGKTVVVEHGGGLKSFYSNLSTVSVSVGDILSKGHVVGLVGDTGLAEGVTLNFRLYVFDIPVRYYNYEDAGVSVAPEVAKALGLISSEQ